MNSEEMKSIEAGTAKLSGKRFESWWLTYLKGFAFVMPALVAWAFACVFLVPKVREICEQVGVGPAVTGRLWEGTLLLVGYGRPALVGVIVSLIFLELLGRGWFRWRRITVGILVWIGNFAVLFGLVALLILVLVAAPGLAHGK
jgi:hypothetical protein